MEPDKESPPPSPPSTEDRDDFIARFLGITNAPRIDDEELTDAQRQVIKALYTIKRPIREGIIR